MLFTFPLRYWFTIGRQRVFSLTGWCRQFQTGFLWSRPTQDTVRPAQFLFTRLSRPMAQLSRWFYLIMVSKNSPTTPWWHATMVWALPRSLATTWGIICYFLFLRVLRCFSSPGWLLSVICLQHIGLSHSEIYGFNARVQLPVAYRSLPRPSSPLVVQAFTIRP